MVPIIILKLADNSSINGEGASVCICLAECRHQGWKLLHSHVRQTTPTTRLPPSALLTVGSTWASKLPASGGRSLLVAFSIKVHPTWLIVECFAQTQLPSSLMVPEVSEVTIFVSWSKSPKTWHKVTELDTEFSWNFISLPKNINKAHELTSSMINPKIPS